VVVELTGIEFIKHLTERKKEEEERMAGGEGMVKEGGELWYHGETSSLHTYLPTHPPTWHRTKAVKMKVK